MSTAGNPGPSGLGGCQTAALATGGTVGRHRSIPVRLTEPLCPVRLGLWARLVKILRDTAWLHTVG